MRERQARKQLAGTVTRPSLICPAVIISQKKRCRHCWLKQ